MIVIFTWLSEQPEHSCSIDRACRLGSGRPARDGAQCSRRAARVAAPTAQQPHMAKSPKSKTKSARKRKAQTKAGVAGTRSDSKQAKLIEMLKAAGRRDDRRDRQEARVAATHGARRHRRRTQEEARARRAVREGGGPWTSLPHRKLNYRRARGLDLAAFRARVAWVHIR